MKNMKRISILVALLVSSMLFSTIVDAQHRRRRDRTRTPTYEYQAPRTHTRDGGHAGAPLDGGLLALLAGAGAIYVAKRKKKKNAE